MLLRALPCLALVALTFIGGGCGIGSKSDFDFSSVSIELDETFSSTENSKLRDDFKRLKNLELKDNDQPWFKEVFGGDQASYVIRYLDTRINYLLSPTTDPYSYSSAQTRENQLKTTAQNLGIMAWLYQEIDGQKYPMTINEKEVRVNSPRVGVVRLGTAYFDVGTSVARVKTLVHEARHSDCARRPTRRAMTATLNGQNENPLDLACGHLHSLCPQGHTFEGYYACENMPWGAYAAGGIFSSAVSKTCDDCSEKEIQAAITVAADSFERVLILDEMLDGKFGSPNMDGI